MRMLYAQFTHAIGLNDIVDALLAKRNDYPTRMRRIVAIIEVDGEERDAISFMSAPQRGHMRGSPRWGSPGAGVMLSIVQ